VPSLPLSLQANFLRLSISSHLLILTRITPPSFEMGKKRVLVSYGVDVDAVAGWLGSYGGEDSTSDISRGIFAGTIGTQRLLKLFKKVRAV
jgi:hypothetical protein